VRLPLGGLFVLDFFNFREEKLEASWNHRSFLLSII
jgi:hypothetical protein